MGRFGVLKELHHDRLCKYVDIVKGRHEQLFLLSEHYNQSTLRGAIKEAASRGHLLPEATVSRYTFQLLQALAYLDAHGITHRCLSSDEVLLTTNGDCKLASRC